MFSLSSVARCTCCIFASQKISSTGVAAVACVAFAVDEDDDVPETTISPIRFPNSMFISLLVSETTFSVSVANAIVGVTDSVRGGLSETLVFAAFPKKVVNSLFPVDKKRITVVDG